MNLHKLHQLLKNDEGFKLDFKLKLGLELESEKKEFVKDVIAIANTPGGRGYIIFGVEDQTRHIVGLSEIPEHVEERIQQIIANRTSPPVPVRFDLLQVKDKKVGVVTIFKSMQVPHQMIQTGAFYIRRGSTTDKANRHEIANMLQQFGMLSFENVPCRNSSLSDLSEETIKKHIGILNSNPFQQKLILCTMGIIACDLEKEKYYPTYGGLLLFGKRPQDFIPQAILEVEQEGVSIGIGGNVIDMLEAFKKRMKQMLPKNYPLEGLVEVVTNAIIHRSYWNNGQYTHVQISEEAIVVTNPMNHEIYGVKVSRWRVNPWLYSRLLIMQQQKSFHLGIGLEKAKELFKSKGTVKIETKPMEGIFEVTLPGLRNYKKKRDNEIIKS
ncbi:MAG: putative DNA binding domain-containing protein [Candidatus Cellulosilyticum pullistercoris]|uniref:DNA binding domain-containing protein n=1 Tax=Candidatus Cellulosilyticum pullistercoris TaxID=2838521 RepID=A0A9E2KB24_9FIRM|nr:putative DNA binding domain-containing protein [Candidatus Cellulosilyticum pullistercoris]